jgi:hypothetical protein
LKHGSPQTHEHNGDTPTPSSPSPVDHDSDAVYIAAIALVRSAPSVSLAGDDCSVALAVVGRSPCSLIVRQRGRTSAPRSPNSGIPLYRLHAALRL